MDLSNENIIHIKQEGMQYLQFRRLLEYSDIITHVYSIGIDKDYRTIGVNLEEIPNNKYTKNLKNYENLCNCININYINLTRPTQCHSDKVKVVNKKSFYRKIVYNVF